MPVSASTLYRVQITMDTPGGDIMVLSQLIADPRDAVNAARGLAECDKDRKAHIRRGTRDKTRGKILAVIYADGTTRCFQTDDAHLCAAMGGK